MRNSIENQRRYRANHPEKVKACNKAYREKNRAKINAYARIHNKPHPDSRKYALKHCHSMTEEEFNELFAEQKGKCAICGKHQSEFKKALHIDHCHKTGKLRGLLCSNCNTGIGLFKDDIENLKCAILYLNK